MSNKRRAGSDALKVAHETAKGLFKAGAIDQTTMNDFDALCLRVGGRPAPCAARRPRSSRRGGRGR